MFIIFIYCVVGIIAFLYCAMVIMNKYQRKQQLKQRIYPTLRLQRVLNNLKNIYPGVKLGYRCDTKLPTIPILKLSGELGFNLIIIPSNINKTLWHIPSRGDERMYAISIDDAEALTRAQFRAIFTNHDI